MRASLPRSIQRAAHRHGMHGGRVLRLCIVGLLFTTACISMLYTTMRGRLHSQQAVLIGLFLLVALVLFDYRGALLLARAAIQGLAAYRRAPSRTE